MRAPLRRFKIVLKEIVEIVKNTNRRESPEH